MLQCKLDGSTLNYLWLEVSEGVDENVVIVLQSGELLDRLLTEGWGQLWRRDERRHIVGPQLDAEHTPRVQTARVRRRHRQRQPPRAHLPVDEVDGARLRQERNGGHAGGARHAARPRQVRVVHQHARRPPRARLGEEELRQRRRPVSLQGAEVLPGVRERGHAAGVVEAVGDGGHAEGVPRWRRGGEHVLRGDEGGAEAVVREAAPELEHRVGVALRRRERQQEHLPAVVVVL
ncbi:Os04g0204150, partial [Oryza sativa Japonica Group]